MQWELSETEVVLIHPFCKTHPLKRKNVEAYMGDIVEYYYAVAIINNHQSLKNFTKDIYSLHKLVVEQLR